MSEPLRVAFVLPHMRPGGAERVVLNWLGALDRGRFAPTLFLARPEGAFLDLVPEDVPVIALGATRARNLPGRLNERLRRERIDVAYSATNAMNLALLAAGLAHRGGPLRIVSEHTSPAAYLAEAKHPWARRLLMRHLYPRAALVAVPTEAVAAELKHVLGRPALPTLVLPNPVVAKVTPTARAARDGPARMVAAGRLVPAKGFDLLIDAAALLQERGVDFKLDIFGEGPERDALAARIAAAGLGERVRLRGHAASLDDELRAADLFVLSSRREGFGNVLIEAMAVGTPVLATRCPGPEAIVTDGETGFLVPPDHPRALADAAARLIGDPAARQAVTGVAARVAAQYEIGRATRALEAVLLDLARPTRVPLGDNRA